MNFKKYTTKSVEKDAYRITGADIDKIMGFGSHHILEGVSFSASTHVLQGDYLIYEKEDDIYHCPADVFKGKYTSIGELMDFGQAINAMKRGYKMQREGWNGKNMYIELQEPTGLSKMTCPYIYMKTADNQLIPWFASQSDMLATDWKGV